MICCDNDNNDKNYLGDQRPLSELPLCAYSKGQYFFDKSARYKSYQTNHPLFQGHKNLKHKRCLFMESNWTVHGSYGVHETWFLLLTYWESLQTPLVVDDQTNHSTHLFAALLPSSNQTWLAGKFRLLGWFFPQMPMFLRISQPRLMTLENMIHFPTAISSPPTSGFVWKWSHWNSIMWHCIPWYSITIH